MAARKKVPSVETKKKEPENPDKQVATRGYVKCIARQVHNHTHRQNMKFTFTGALCAASWILLAAVIVTAPIAVRPFPEVSYWIVVAIAIITTAVTIDLVYADDEDVGYPDDMGIIEEWEKPICCNDDDEDDDCYMA